MKDLKRNKAVVGLSGGVDSTAAVLLLKEQGFEVIGVYLDVLGYNIKGKESALEIAKQLSIAFVSIDVSAEFEKVVISDFCNEYMNGRTPNPCVLCNPEVKFKNLVKAADEQGAYHISTGHYARSLYENSENRYYISKAKSEDKDQSYMLYRLGQQVIERLILPLGELESKHEVRRLVAEKGIKNADSRDSQEICFLPEGAHYADYLAARGYRAEKGDFIDVSGKVIGRHNGIWNYTIGQRKKLGTTFGKPMFVLNIDHESNTVTLGNDGDLLNPEVISSCNWFPKCGCGELPEEYKGLSVLAKVRYAAKASEAVIEKIDGHSVKTVFAKAQRAVTPGQSIVFYSGDKVIGGGVIS